MYLHASLIVAGIVNMLLLVGVESAAEYSSDSGSDGSHDGDESVSGIVWNLPVQPYPVQPPVQPRFTVQLRDVTAETLPTRAAECAWAMWQSKSNLLGGRLVQELRASGPGGERLIDKAFALLNDHLNRLAQPAQQFDTYLLGNARKAFADGPLFDFAGSTTEITAIIRDCFNFFDRIDPLMKLARAHVNYLATPPSPMSLLPMPPVDSEELSLPPSSALFRAETAKTLLTRCAECRWAAFQLFQTTPCGNNSLPEIRARLVWIGNVEMTIEYLLNVVQPTGQLKKTTFITLRNLFRNGLLFDLNNPTDELAAIARDCANLFERLDQVVRQNVLTTPSPSTLPQLSPVD